MSKMKQPDFSKIFFDHFGGEPKKVRYELRVEPYLNHDLKFLSSLIHDSIFKLSDIKRLEEELTLILQRDCWELRNPEKDRQLLTTSSKLTFKGIKDVEWSIKNIEDYKNEEFEIYNFYRIEKSLPLRETVTLVLCGYPYHWELKIILDDENFQVVLQDIETPK